MLTVYLVHWVGLMSDRLGNFNEGGQEIMSLITTKTTFSQFGEEFLFIFAK